MTFAEPFKDAVADYAQAGWPCILPVPPETKTPPPVGYTGAEGRDTDPLTLVGWAGTHGDSSIALRMPDGVIGIDVDQYAKGSVQKHGAQTLAAHLQLWGPLPPTWTSTARDPAGPSRIYFFRVPVQRYATRLKTELTSDVEIIQRHHRYAVVWPSNHHDAGTYTWYDPAGQPCAVPSPAQLPELPQAWVDGLAAGATDQGPAMATYGAGEALLGQLLDDWRPECADLTSARFVSLDELSRADAGSRHDTMTGRVHALVQLAAAGHTGVAHAVSVLRQEWEKLTAGEDRGDEFERMLLTSARKAVSVVGLRQVTRDPCLLIHGFEVPAPVAEAVDEDGAPLAPVESARWFYPLEVIGAHAFDPVAQLDQPLAQAVLERTYPLIRYAYDARNWLIRGPEEWRIVKGKPTELASWAVAQVAPLLPVGNPLAEKGSDDFARSQRRGRFNANAGAKAIAAKMTDLVIGGTHPCTLRLSDLDAEHYVIWAGGEPWDLRYCRPDAPIESWAARLDPATPHLHAAGVRPDRVPTPLWDAFLAAVWPDEALRRWALRVLSIALTGYADRALPILLGDTGRGKTQVITLLMSVLGSYAHAADPKLLSPAGEKTATGSILFALKGRRLSFIDEGPREGRFAQERLKQITGGGDLSADEKYQSSVTFRPTHTLVLTANEEPILTDPAVRSRSRLIPCDGDPEQVRGTRAAIGHIGGQTWRAEAPGVLAAMMSEASAWLADPFSALQTAAPESIRYLAEYLAADQDPVMTWLTEETEPWEAGTSSRELYAAFVGSCKSRNMRFDLIPTETKWGRVLSRAGYDATHTRRGSVRPLRIRPLGWATPPGDGLPPSGEGLVTGSHTNPSQVFSQVNLPFSYSGDRLTGSTGEKPTHAHAPAHTYEPLPDSGATSHTPQGETAPDLRKHHPNAPEQPLTEPLTPAKPRAKRERTPEQLAAAAEKAAGLRAAKLAEAIAAADGGHVGLPALVTPDGGVRRLWTLEDAHQLLATVTDALTVDVEHTGYPIGHADYALRTIQLGDEHFAVVLDAADPEHTAVAAEHLARVPVLHAHSATADLVPLAVAGLVDHEEAWTRMRDTAIPAKLADPSSTGNDASLKKLAPAVLGAQAVSPAADEARAALFKAGKWLTEVKTTTAAARSGWANVDPTCATMVRYAGADVLDDAAIARRLPWPAEHELERELTAQRLTARIAYRGLPLDADQVNTLLPAQQAALADAGARLRQLSGGAIENPGSDVQVATAATALGAALPRTATGRASVAKGALEQYSKLEGPLGDFVRARLDYQKAETALGLFLEPYRQLLERGDGRARPTVYTLGADTGRMSCVRPNLQQVPREGGYRACITADPGHLLISADFASVELRVAAALSQDPNLLEMLAQGVDLHWQAARQVFGPQATKADRYQVKRGVFGWLYGGKAPTLAGHMGVSQPTAQALIDTMAAMLPGVTEWARMTKNGVESGHTQFQTYAGRIVHMPVKAPHAGPNYCIQGTARELLIDALMRWSKTRWGGCVLLPVHDEVLAMVPEGEADEALATLTECMTNEVFGIPIIAEASEPSFAWKDAA